MGGFPNIRARRNRQSAAVRSLVRETRLSAEQLILPMFVIDGQNQRVPIKSMPGQFRLSIDELVKTAGEAYDLGISGLAIFPVVPEAQKDKWAGEALNPHGLVPRALAALREAVPGMALITDVAMDPYSSDGHDGLVEGGQIVNDATLEILAEMAITQARAGADWVAPSDMMDGRVGYIRNALDSAGFKDTAILSYAAKYASAFYGPFRDALDSAPRHGDKKTYQMDPANRREAWREVELDIHEGADIVMVKPAGAYLDIIADIRQRATVPVAAYQVSGEYAMIYAAAERGWLHRETAMLESVVAIRRAGADMILTYFALDVARILRL